MRSKFTPFFGATIGALFIIVMIGMIGLSGCQSIRDPNNSVIVQLTTQVAVGKFIESKNDRIGTAKHIIDITTQVKAIADSDSTTVGALQALANARLAQLNLEPSDQLLAAALINVLATELKSKVGDGLLSAQDRIILGQILDTVALTANVYIPVNR